MKFKMVKTPEIKDIDGMEDGVIDTDRSYPIPSQMKRHPGVSEVGDGPQQGFDYKWCVALKEGWVFENGRMAGGRYGNFNTWQDFHNAHPVKCK